MAKYCIFATIKYFVTFHLKDSNFSKISYL